MGALDDQACDFAAANDPALSRRSSIELRCRLNNLFRIMAPRQDASSSGCWQIRAPGCQGSEGKGLSPRAREKEASSCCALDDSSAQAPCCTGALGRSCSVCGLSCGCCCCDAAAPGCCAFAERIADSGGELGSPWSADGPLSAEGLLRRQYYTGVAKKAWRVLKVGDRCDKAFPKGNLDHQRAIFTSDTCVSHARCRSNWFCAMSFRKHFILAIFSTLAL